MCGLPVIPQNVAAWQIYAPMRRFVPITSANFPDCNSLSISTPNRYAPQPFPAASPPSPQHGGLPQSTHKTHVPMLSAPDREDRGIRWVPGAPFMRSHRMSGNRAKHDRLHIDCLTTRKKSTNRPASLIFPPSSIRSNPRNPWSPALVFPQPS